MKSKYDMKKVGHIEAGIVVLFDVIDALTSECPYKNGWHSKTTKSGIQINLTGYTLS